MLYDSGKSLKYLNNISLTELIESLNFISGTLEDISKRHFVIIDLNVDNIIFSNYFKCVDTYSFILWKK